MKWMSNISKPKKAEGADFCIFFFEVSTPREHFKYPTMIDNERIRNIARNILSMILDLFFHKLYSISSYIGIGS